MYRQNIKVKPLVVSKKTYEPATMGATTYCAWHIGRFELAHAALCKPKTTFFHQFWQKPTWRFGSNFCTGEIYLANHERAEVELSRLVHRPLQVVGECQPLPLQTIKIDVLHPPHNPGKFEFWLGDMKLGYYLIRRRSLHSMFFFNSVKNICFEEGLEEFKCRFRDKTKGLAHAEIEVQH